MANAYSSQDILLRTNTQNAHMQYYGMDTQSHLNTYRDKIDPRLQHITIDYVWNSHGYRCIEFDQLLNISDFVMCSGCSYTEGVGLPEQYTISGRIQEHIGMQSINMGISGSGIDNLLHNHVSWIRAGYPLPRLVIQQIPNISRRNYAEITQINNNAGEICMEFGCVNVWNSMDPHCHVQYSDAEQIKKQTLHEGIVPEQLRDPERTVSVSHGYDVTHHYNSGRCCEIIQLLYNQLGVPVLFYTNHGDGDLVFNTHDVLLCETVDFARDRAHDGIDTINSIATALGARWQQLKDWEPSQGDQPFGRTVNTQIKTYQEGLDAVGQTHKRNNARKFIYE